MKLVADLDTR